MSTGSKGASSHALYPGTFDPPTLGHLDLIRRAQRLFGRVTVALASNADKAELLSIEERFELLSVLSAELEGVQVTHLDGLVVEGARKVAATVLVRGVRHAGDLEYEAQMARSNAALAPEIETVLLFSSPEHVHISSTLVRQVAALGGDLAPFVPPAVRDALARAGGPSQPSP